MKPLVERFLEKVDKTADCWLWRGAMAAGYGLFTIGRRRSTTAHRAALMLLRGMELPTGHSEHVDHICGNKRCVNPDHLELVTAAENIRRRDVARFGAPLRQVCKHGHTMTPQNIYQGPKGDRRICRACAVRRAQVHRKSHANH